MALRFTPQFLAFSASGSSAVTCADGFIPKAVQGIGSLVGIGDAHGRGDPTYNDPIPPAVAMAIRRGKTRRRMEGLMDISDKMKQP